MSCLIMSCHAAVLLLLSMCYRFAVFATLGRGCEFFTMNFTDLVSELPIVPIAPGERSSLVIKGNGVGVPTGNLHITYVL